MENKYCNEAETFAEWMNNPHMDWLIPEAIANCDNDQLNALIDRNPAIVQNIKPISENHLIRATRLLPWAWSVVNKKYVTFSVFKVAQEVAFNIVEKHLKTCLENKRVLVQAPDLHEELDYLLEQLQKNSNTIKGFSVSSYLAFKEQDDKLELIYKIIGCERK